MQKPEYLCLTLPEAEATKEAERADSLSERAALDDIQSAT